MYLVLIFSKPKLSFNFCRLIFDVSGAESEQTFWNVALPTRQTVPKTPHSGDVTSSIFVVIGIDDQVTFVIAETTLIYLPSRIPWPKGLIAEMLLSGGRSVKLEGADVARSNHAQLSN